MPTTDAPNILVILSDQLRRDALGVYGDPNVRTPHIDALAAGGVRFRNACSTFPVCVPFRFSLMTGEYAHSRQVPAIGYRLSPAERTLADAFNAADYDTLYIGKWHLYGICGVLPADGEARARRTPVPREHQGGWRKWLGFELNNAPFHSLYFEDDDPTPRTLKGYQTDGLFRLAQETLTHRQAPERPFMCVLSVEPPHFPLEAPAALEAAWRERPLHVRPSFLRPTDYAIPLDSEAFPRGTPEEVLRKLRLYYAMIENLDANVGRIMAHLKTSGLDRNTIVVLLSDHGEMGGCHNLRNTVKEYPFEESIGIPLIVHDPRHPERAGTVVDDPVHTEDLYPTLLGLAGLPPEPKPGLDLTPRIHGHQERLPREGVLLEFTHDLRPLCAFHREQWRGYRTARHKYTVLGGPAGARPWQFFDLETDPHEMHNRINNPADRATLTHLHQALRDQLIATGDPFVLLPAFGQEGLNLWQP